MWSKIWLELIALWAPGAKGRRKGIDVLLRLLRSTQNGKSDALKDARKRFFQKFSIDPRNDFGIIAERSTPKGAKNKISMT